MKVEVAVHGRFHAFDLAKGLYRKGHLGTLHTTYPSFAVRRVTGVGLTLNCAPHLEVIRRLAQRSTRQDVTDFILERFGRFVARNLGRSGTDLLVGWSSVTLEAIPVARDKGMAVVVDRGASHIVHQDNILTMAYQELDLEFPGISRRVIGREMKEYLAADKIIVPSTVAANSFVDHGIAPEKLAVVRLGVDTERFRPVARSSRSGKPRILFVGSIGIQKGTPRLLQSFAPLSRQAELHLVGPVEQEFARALEGLPTDGVTFRGPVAKHKIPKIYTEADIFCLPSVHEGFGMVVLEAMAAGLPVVVSDQVGAADVINNGESGYVFPVASGEALTEILAGLICNPKLRQEIGQTARQEAESRENTWDGYVDRVVPVLSSVAGR
ncbi:MAG: glycosyltransferase family 4 protein [Pseudomonadota bacterium]|nr:glycosyltransferase family 4 protein [Pseudomonadota bacterium]